ncbi:MAG: type II toxin-antitoxin system Phd/YefM family antitoxin [Erysipelotrichaceae bacterium]|nr:type II toxin-antitoxin system Phd/YefM family antitoxin [Erysipelotrichaceae bacterium]
MPTIISSAEFRNNYAEVCEHCHQSGETIFVTKNGKGDIAVLSIEAYDRIMNLLAAREKVVRGFEEARSGDTVSYEETMALAKKSLQ